MIIENISIISGLTEMSLSFFGKRKVNIYYKRPQKPHTLSEVYNLFSRASKDTKWTCIQSLHMCREGTEKVYGNSINVKNNLI